MGEQYGALRRGRNEHWRLWRLVSSSWLEGIPELTKSEEVQAVCYHYIKGMV